MSLRLTKKKEGQVSLSESRVAGPSPGRNGTAPLPAPAAIDLLAALHAGLLDPELRQERLVEAIAHDTDLAVPLTDDEGRPRQESIGSRPMALHRSPKEFTASAAEISGPLHTEVERRLAEELAEQVAMVVENAGLNRALREADRLKDEFFAVVGHELRSPLATIGSVMQLVRLKSLADPELGLATEVLERQVQQMTRLIDDAAWSTIFPSRNGARSTFRRRSWT